MFGQNWSIGRRLVARQQIKIIDFIPIVGVAHQTSHFKICLHTERMQHSYNFQGNMQLETTILSAMSPQLLATQNEIRVGTLRTPTFPPDRPISYNQ